jgi:predicted Zn finger-like uncharacterized protein
MLVSCSACGKRYRVDPAKVPAALMAFDCRSCGHAIPLPCAPAAVEPRILMVMGEPEISALVLSILKRGGMTGVPSQTGAQAAATMGRERFAALFLSVVLPDMLGYELIDCARSCPGGEQMPILLLSSLYRTARYKRAPTSLYGADDYIELHHLPDFLLPKLRGFLERGRVRSPVLPVAGAPPLPTLEEREESRRIEEAAPERSGEDSDRQAAAQRMARIIVGDIALYNEEVIAGRMPREAIEALRRDLDEGRRLMAERFPEMSDEAQGFLAREMKRFLTARLRGHEKGEGHGEP